MAGDLDELTFGARLQQLRDRRGLSRVVLGGLVGRSASWVKKAEKQNVVPDLDMLVRLAKALKLRSIEDLVGQLEVPVMLDISRTGHADAGRIQDAIMAWDIAATDDPVASEVLRQRVRETAHLWHMDSAPREATARLLPELIRDGRRAIRVFEGNERRAAAAALVEAYALAEHWLSWIGDRGVMMVIADRAMSAAEIADDPHAMAEAAWAWGNVLRYIDVDRSISLLDQVAKPLRHVMDNDTATNEQAAMWGALQLHQAVTHAQAGSEGNALRHLDNAAKTADRLPRGWQHPVTVFAPYNVQIHGVSVWAELHKGNEGSRSALRIDPSTIPGPYRRSRLWLDTARTQWAAGEAMGAVTALSNACEVSLENMRYSPPAKTLAGQLVDDGGAMIAPQARRIARGLGLVT